MISIEFGDVDQWLAGTVPEAQEMLRVPLPACVVTEFVASQLAIDESGIASSFEKVIHFRL